MNNTKQAEILQQVLDLEIKIKQYKRNLENLRAERFDSAPLPPTQQVVNRTYPEIIPTVKFDKVKAFAPLIISLLCFIPGLYFIGFLFWPAIIWLIYYRFKVFKKEKEDNIEEIRNSSEYKAKCAECDKVFDKQQAELDKVYEGAKKEYDTKILPNYQMELDKWTTKHENELCEQENILKNSEIELKNLYDATKIVPMQYRDIEALQYITDMVSSSDYDVKQAIESYDKKVQRDLDMKKIQEQQIANQLADEQANLLAEQADLLEKQNRIAEKARRDANIAAVVGTVQRHNTNKILKGR